MSKVDGGCDVAEGGGSEGEAATSEELSLKRSRVSLGPSCHFFFSPTTPLPATQSAPAVPAEAPASAIPEPGSEAPAGRNAPAVVSQPAPTVVSAPAAVVTPAVAVPAVDKPATAVDKPVPAVAKPAAAAAVSGDTAKKPKATRSKKANAATTTANAEPKPDSEVKGKKATNGKEGKKKGVGKDADDVETMDSILARANSTAKVLTAEERAAAHKAFLDSQIAISDTMLGYGRVSLTNLAPYVQHWSNFRTLDPVNLEKIARTILFGNLENFRYPLILGVRPSDIISPLSPTLNPSEMSECITFNPNALIHIIAGNHRAHLHTVMPKLVEEATQDALNQINNLKASGADETTMKDASIAFAARRANWLEIMELTTTWPVQIFDLDTVPTSVVLSLASNALPVSKPADEEETNVTVAMKLRSLYPNIKEFFDLPHDKQNDAMAPLLVACSSNVEYVWQNPQLRPHVYRRVRYVGLRYAIKMSVVYKTWLKDHGFIISGVIDHALNGMDSLIQALSAPGITVTDTLLYEVWSTDIIEAASRILSEVFNEMWYKDELPDGTSRVAVFPPTESQLERHQEFDHTSPDTVLAKIFEKFWSEMALEFGRQAPSVADAEMRELYLKLVDHIPMWHMQGELPLPVVCPTFIDLLEHMLRPMRRTFMLLGMSINPLTLSFQPGGGRAAHLTMSTTHRLALYLQSEAFVEPSKAASVAFEFTALLPDLFKVESSLICFDNAAEQAKTAASVFAQMKKHSAYNAWFFDKASPPGIRKKDARVATRNALYDAFNHDQVFGIEGLNQIIAFYKDHRLEWCATQLNTNGTAGGNQANAGDSMLKTLGNAASFTHHVMDSMRRNVSWSVARKRVEQFVHSVHERCQPPPPSNYTAETRAAWIASKSLKSDAPWWQSKDLYISLPDTADDPNSKAALDHVNGLLSTLSRTEAGQHQSFQAVIKALTRLCAHRPEDSDDKYLDIASNFLTQTDKFLYKWRKPLREEIRDADEEYCDASGQSVLDEQGPGVKSFAFEWPPNSPATSAPKPAFVAHDHEPVITDRRVQSVPMEEAPEAIAPDGEQEEEEGDEERILDQQEREADEMEADEDVNRAEKAREALLAAQQNRGLSDKDVERPKNLVLQKKTPPAPSVQWGGPQERHTDRVNLPQYDASKDSGQWVPTSVVAAAMSGQKKFYRFLAEPYTWETLPMYLDSTGNRRLHRMWFVAYPTATKFKLVLSHIPATMSSKFYEVVRDPNEEKASTKKAGSRKKGASSAADEEEDPTPSTSTKEASKSRPKQRVNRNVLPQPPTDGGSGDLGESTIVSATGDDQLPGARKPGVKRGRTGIDDQKGENKKISLKCGTSQGQKFSDTVWTSMDTEEPADHGVNRLEPIRAPQPNANQQAAVDQAVSDYIESERTNGTLDDTFGIPTTPHHPAQLPEQFEPDENDRLLYAQDHSATHNLAHIGSLTTEERADAIDGHIRRLRRSVPHIIRMSEMERLWDGYVNQDSDSDLKSLRFLTQRQRYEFDSAVAYPPTHRHCELINLRKVASDIDSISFVSTKNSGFDMVVPSGHMAYQWRIALFPNHSSYLREFKERKAKIGFEVNENTVWMGRVRSLDVYII
ncbi:hypothetical protein SISNIDRAFT_498775, partial [Sistotremastrum niveocremeum HHB9708]